METEQLATVYERARRSWPGVEVPIEPFAQQLEKVTYSEEHAEYAGALYLCTGCAIGVPAAIRALERTEFPRLRVTLVDVARQGHVIDDLLQEVRSRLLVGTPAKISSYRGRGPLASWLRVIASRVAVDYWRTQALQRRRVRALSDHIEATTGTRTSGEREPDGRRAREIGRSFSEAILALDAADKQLLRHYFVSRVSVDVLGRIYDIDRSTAARRVQRAVNRIHKGVHQRVAAGLARTSRREVDDLLASYVEQIEVDLASLLGASAGQGLAGQRCGGDRGTGRHSSPPSATP